MQKIVLAEHISVLSGFGKKSGCGTAPPDRFAVTRWMRVRWKGVMRCCTVTPLKPRRHGLYLIYLFRSASKARFRPQRNVFSISRGDTIVLSLESALTLVSCTNQYWTVKPCSLQDYSEDLELDLHWREPRIAGEMQKNGDSWGVSLFLSTIWIEMLHWRRTLNVERRGARRRTMVAYVYFREFAVTLVRTSMLNGSG
jgi:hypothetical protein